MIGWIILFFSAIYLIIMIVLYFGLNRLDQFKPERSDTPFVSVIVPARNEAANIINCLMALTNQTYPSHYFEIIIVDDSSKDETADLVKNFMRTHENIHLYHHKNSGHVSAKKSALTLGMSHAKGEIIFTTDADCEVPPKWLEIMTPYFGCDVAVVASWLGVSPGRTLLSRLESVDALAFVLAGAAGFGFQRPFLANGANLAYRRSVFEELKGFTGHENYASGDDDLFLQNVSKAAKWRCVFVKDPACTVYTDPNPSLKSFLAQRFRWASKSRVYSLPLVCLEIFLWLYLLMLAIGVPLALFAALPLVPFLASVMLKFSADFMFLQRGASFLNQSIPSHIFLLTEVFHTFYILVAGIWGQFGSYTWKGRKYSKGKVKKQAESID